ncbi:UNVERIFIED_CONTAM: hypothetical protein PYX00_001713 [Menopon gallinae]|uniref:Homeobox domain-containing protein n=1 Tax=Menopon gallinae TaxID=328185 RepID=A0AAW2IFA7_9NEOP
MSHIVFKGSPSNQSAISPVGANSPRPGSQPSPAIETGSAPAMTAARPGSPPGRCCDTGRPLFTDPITGQTVCSCQYDLLSYQRLASAGVSPAGLPALSMYSAPYADGMAAYFPALGADQAPFYTPSAGLELKDNLAAGAASWPYPSVYHPYDSFGYPFNGYGMDLNGARRKNATRETTSTLKAWLNEHKKNPYPTKGEKIMLAIITKMTLTQVSTWFANARRRLKKENKMTWEPRNRVEEEDNNNDESGRKSADNVKDPDSKDSGTGSSEDGERPNHRMELLDRPCGPGADTGSEWSESRADSGPDSPECLFERQQQLLHPAYQHLQHPRLHVPSSSSPSGPPKPRIWSLADMASKETDIHTSPATTSAFYATAAGKLISPLSRSGMPPLSVPHGTYPRPPPHEFYRSLYNPHLAGGASGDGVSLLETYSRTFGAGPPAGPGGQLSTVLSKVAAAAAATSGSPSFSLNGTAQSVATGASSTSSSGSSASEHPVPPKQLQDHLKGTVGKP